MNYYIRFLETFYLLYFNEVNIAEMLLTTWNHKNHTRNIILSVSMHILPPTRNDTVYKELILTFGGRLKYVITEYNEFLTHKAEINNRTESVNAISTSSEAVSHHYLFFKVPVLKVIFVCFQSYLPVFVAV